MGLSSPQIDSQTKDSTGFSCTPEQMERFLRLASHDLMEPLRMVNSYTELVQNRYSEQLSTEAQTFLSFAVDGSKRVQSLISDLLLFFRVSTSDSRKEPCSLKEAVGLAQSELFAEIEERSGSFAIEGELPIIQGDPGQLTVLLKHLIDNSLRYCPSHAPRIEIHGFSHASSVGVRFQDNGIGIPAESQTRVFELFERLHHRSEYPGSGVGLALCRRIMDRHGGAIRVESAGNPGTTIILEFPPMDPLRGMP